MRKIHLHGSIGKYGPVLELDVSTASEAMAALFANFPNMQDDIRQGSWIVVRGDPQTGICLDEEAFAGLHLGDKDVHIMPEVMGAKKGGVLKAILGVTLIVLSGGSAAFLANPIAGGLLGATTWGNALGQLGLVMALGGVSQMLSPETDDGDEDTQSYTLSGPTSSNGQGSPVQVAYGGPIVVGGMMISGGVDAEQMTTAEEITPEDDIEEVEVGTPSAPRVSGDGGN